LHEHLQREENDEHLQTAPFSENDEKGWKMDMAIFNPSFKWPHVTTLPSERIAANAPSWAVRPPYVEATHEIG